MFHIFHSSLLNYLISPFSLTYFFFPFVQGAIVEELVGRRTGKREHEYEIVWEGQGKENSWASRTELIEMGYQKMVNQKDEQIAMESMLGQRKLTTGEIQKHFDGFGLEPQFAQHTRMGALSGTPTTQQHKHINPIYLSTHPHTPSQVPSLPTYLPTYHKTPAWHTTTNLRHLIHPHSHSSFSLVATIIPLLSQVVKR